MRYGTRLMSPVEAAASLPPEPGRFASLLRHIRRYMTVGVGSTLTDFTVYVLVTRYGGWSAVAGNLISRPCGGLFSFLVNKLWTFERREVRGTVLQMNRFWLVWLAAYGTTSALVLVLSRSMGWGALACKVTAEVIVGPLVFAAMRHWTFRRPRDSGGST